MKWIYLSQESRFNFIGLTEDGVNVLGIITENETAVNVKKPDFTITITASTNSHQEMKAGRGGENTREKSMKLDNSLSVDGILKLIKSEVSKWYSETYKICEVEKPLEPDALEIDDGVCTPDEESINTGEGITLDDGVCTPDEESINTGEGITLDDGSENTDDVENKDKTVISEAGDPDAAIVEYETDNVM